MGEYRFVKRNGILKDQVKDEKKPNPQDAFNKSGKPALEQIQKRPNVLIIESDHHVLLVIEAALKAKCDVRAYRVVLSVENGFELARSPVDVVVIGPLFTNCPDMLAQKIKKESPETKIIKLAGTAEYKRITSEFPAVSGTSIFDEVLQFSRLAELEGIILNLYHRGNAGNNDV